MATEEQKKNADAGQSAIQEVAPGTVGNGDIAHLIGNVGILIDSTIESVQDMISSAGSATGQIIGDVTSNINSDTVKDTFESVQGMITTVSTSTGQFIEGVTSTINSDAVKETIESVQEMISTVGSATGQIIDGVTATFQSEPVQNSFNELGKFWENLMGSLNDTVNSNQVKNLFENVSSGLGQLVGNVFSAPGASFGAVDDRKKHVQEIPLISKQIPSGAPKKF